jgi:hypothetical protein
MRQWEELGTPLRLKCHNSLSTLKSSVPQRGPVYPSDYTGLPVQVRREGIQDPPSSSLAVPVRTPIHASAHTVMAQTALAIGVDWEQWEVYEQFCERYHPYRAPRRVLLLVHMAGDGRTGGHNDSEVEIQGNIAARGNAGSTINPSSNQH